MKTYGENRDDLRAEKFTTDSAGGWSGRQSRKVANRRRKDKKVMHRRARRTAAIESEQA
jgi:hypothetical protein